MRFFLFHTNRDRSIPFPANCYDFPEFCYVVCVFFSPIFSVYFSFFFFNEMDLANAYAVKQLRRFSHKLKSEIVVSYVRLSRIWNWLFRYFWAVSLPMSITWIPCKLNDFTLCKDIITRKKNVTVFRILWKQIVSTLFKYLVVVYFKQESCYLSAHN